MTSELFHTRPYREGDLGPVLNLWEREGMPAGPDGLGVDPATDLLPVGAALGRRLHR